MSVNGSFTIEVKSGIAQGLVLDLAFFNLFIYDLKLGISSKMAKFVADGALSGDM